MGRIPTTGRFAACLLAAGAAALVVGVAVVGADAPDPILASTSGSAVLNADGSQTVTIQGGWTWPTHTSDCNLDRRAVGFAVDWFDPAQPGNAVTTLNGTAIAVGAAAANAYNPADNLVHASPAAHDSTSTATWRGGCGTYSAAAGHNTGTWGPISHTYGPSFRGPVTACVLMYDVHLTTNGGAPKAQSEIAAGGSNHNPDVSAEANTKTPLGNGCFQFTVPPPPPTTTGTTATTTTGTTTTAAPPPATPYTGTPTPTASSTPCPVGPTAATSSGVRLIPVPSGA